jgi:uncharacterized membrane-anchored protein
MRQLVLLPLLVTSLIVPARAAAATEAAPAPEAAEPEAAEAEDELPPHLVGPRVVDLGHGVEIDLPAGAQLFEHEVAQQILRAQGDAHEDALAMVTRPDVPWTIWIEYGDIGHVTDEDADELDADGLLESLRAGNAEQNKQRKAMGVLDLVIDGWSEPPRYDRAHRQLLWGVNAHDAESKVVNHFTRVLGRQAIVSIALVCAPEDLAAAKAAAADIIGGVRFQTGSRYEDFDESTDKSSGLGLTGLILGGAAVAKVAKVGIFAAILKFLIAFKKIFILGGLAVAALAGKLIGRGRSAPVASADPGGEPPAT